MMPHPSMGTMGQGSYRFSTLMKQQRKIKAQTNLLGKGEQLSRVLTLKLPSTARF